jgi:hypothetical protein
MFAILGLLAVSSMETPSWLQYGFGWPTFQLILVGLAAVVLWAYLRNQSPRWATVATVALALLFVPYAGVITFLMFNAGLLLMWVIGAIMILLIGLPLAARARRAASGKGKQLPYSSE